MHSKQGDKTAVLEARVDIRILANLYDFFVSQDARPNSKNEIVKLALELAHAYLEKSGHVRPYETVTFTNAYNTLKHYGSLHRGGQNAKKLHQFVTEESCIAEMLDSKGKLSLRQEPFVDPRITKGQEYILQAAIDKRQLERFEWDELTFEEQVDVRARNSHLVPDNADEVVEKRVPSTLVREQGKSSADWRDHDIEEFTKTAERLVTQAQQENRKLTLVEWTMVHETVRHLVPVELIPE